MKKMKLILAMLMLCVLAGCSAGKASESTQNETENTDTISGNELESEETEEPVEFYIETDDVAVVDYTNLDFAISGHDEPTDEDVNDYVSYLLDSYESETGNDLGEDRPLNEDIIYWLTGEEGMTEDAFYEMVFNTLHDYNVNEVFYEDLNTIYSMITEGSELKNYTDEEFETAKAMEIAYVESSAKYNGIELEDYKTQVLNVTSDEEYNKYIEESTLLTLKSDKVIKAIAEKEGLSVSDEQYQEYLTNAASYYGYESEEDLLTVYGEDELKMDILYDVVIEYIYDLYVTEE